MPTIKLRDQLGAEFDVELAERSALMNYLRQIPGVVIEQTDLSNLAALGLNEPAVRALRAGLLFDDGLETGRGTPELRIEAGGHGSFAVIGREPGAERLFAPDALGAGIDVPEDACYVRIGMQASAAAAGTGSGGGLFQFGAEPGTAMEIANYRRFSLEGATLLKALREGIGSFLVPAGAKDLEALPVHGVASVSVTGSLKLSAAAVLAPAAHPLASARLPRSLPAVSLRAGGSVKVGASYEISGKYEVRVHKLDSDRLQVGWYREDGSELRVRVSATAGVAAAIGDRNLVSMLLHAISGDPAADRGELLQAGLPEDRLRGIQAAVQGSVSRNLELAVSTEIGSLRSGEAAFLYEIDLLRATPESREAIAQALRGDLTALHAGPLPGVSCLRSAWTRVQSRSITWNVNLLGIYGFTSVAQLIRNGSVLYEPATGTLVIADQVTAGKIRSVQVNFGADTQKLRRVLAESFLITAAYRGAGNALGGPALRCSHSFFEIRNEMSRENMERHLRAAVALGLLSERETELPAGVVNFGRTTVHLQTEYDDALTAGLFLGADGQPHPQELYESVGRSAIRSLVAENDSAAARRRPAMDDKLWREMKKRGQFNFAPLFPGVPAPVLGAIVADYAAIMWWAGAMTGAGERLAAIRQFLKSNPGVPPKDPVFQSLRKKLADHLEKVAARTTEEFGQPWGLIAMHEVSQHRAAASLLISGSTFARRKTRALAQVASGPDT